MSAVTFHKLLSLGGNLVVLDDFDRKKGRKLKMHGPRERVCRFRWVWGSESGEVGQVSLFIPFRDE